MVPRTSAAPGRRRRAATTPAHVWTKLETGRLGARLAVPLETTDEKKRADARRGEAEAVKDVLEHALPVLPVARALPARDHERAVGAQTAKAAGVTPIVVGGKDKWPLHFVYSLLAMRIVGADGIAAAAAGEDGGFGNDGFVKVGEELVRLAALEPFQRGFMDSGYDKATGLFGDGDGLFHIMGNWDYGASKAGSTSGEGLTDAQTGMISFPMVEGGAGDPTATFGGINGWLATEGASQEAVDFLCFMLNKENQTKAGAEGFWIPVAKGSSGEITNPFNAMVSEHLAGSAYHQLFLDQALGASVGGTVNDVAADLASGATDPEEAANRVEEARMFQ